MLFYSFYKDCQCCFKVFIRILKVLMKIYANVWKIHPKKIYVYIYIKFVFLVFMFYIMCVKGCLMLLYWSARLSWNFMQIHEKKIKQTCSRMCFKCFKCFYNGFNCCLRLLQGFQMFSWNPIRTPGKSSKDVHDLKCVLLFLSCVLMFFMCSYEFLMFSWNLWFPVISY